MNILHYSLGFPPYRSGGLTKFCMDLMLRQIAEGHRVALLWPGEMISLRRKTCIKCRGDHQGIKSYEVFNPTPVSYNEGITHIEAFMENGSEEVYGRFLTEVRPDVIHVHTLMGIHKAFLDAAKKQKIRIVFTAHDFFPICPKVTMFCGGGICRSAKNCEDCAVCNLTALSITKIRLLQSGTYRMLKESRFVRKLRKQHRDNYLSGRAEVSADKAKPVRSAQDYMQLRNHYRSMLETADAIHYNSAVTKEVYESCLNLTGPQAEIIPISHADIKDQRKKKSFGDTLRITYLGPEAEYKGYYLLRDALDELLRGRECGGRDFILNVFFEPQEMTPYIKPHGQYTYAQLETIFDETDVLIVPSVWNETFGYTALEAMSFGVPVIVSDTVGAKDLIPEKAGIVIRDITAEKLADAIRQLDKERLCAMNLAILEKMTIPTLATMNREIIERCYR